MLSVIFAAAVATASPSFENLAPAASAPDRDPVVCHVEPIEGSRITHKVCLRASEIARQRLEARWLLDRAQSVSQAPNMATIAPMGPRR